MGGLRLNEIATPTPWPAAGKDELFAGADGKLRKLDSNGNIWALTEITLMTQVSDLTLSNVNTAQSAFSTPHSGRLVLPASTSYLLEALYMLTNTGTTSHTIATLFAGASGLSLTALDYMVRGRSGTTSQLTLAAESSCSQSNGSGALPTTALVATAASTSATENVLLRLDGILRINAGGLLIPQIQFSAAPGASPKMLRGSYFKLTPIGSNTVADLYAS